MKAARISYQRAIEILKSQLTRYELEGGAAYAAEEPAGRRKYA